MELLRMPAPRAAAFVAVTALLGVHLAAARVSADDEVATHQLAAGTASRAARNDSIGTIPFDLIPAEYRERIQEIVDNPTIFRRMPTMVSRCEPELHQYIATHPEILANVWKILGIDDVALIPTGPDSYRADDGAGTMGVVEILYRDDSTQVVYAEGSYDGPLFRNPVVGRGILILKCGYQRETDGYDYVTSRLDAFVQLDHAAASFLTKTFQPLVGRAADNTFAQTAIFLERLSDAAERQPNGLANLAGRLTDLTPPVRASFVQVTAGVAAKATLRNARLAERAANHATRQSTPTSARR